MQKIIVAKLVRLGKDGDSFSQKLIAQVMRTNAKVTEQYIEQFNSNWKDRGQMYIVDEEKTKERNELLSTSEKANSPELSIREALKKEADEMEAHLANISEAAREAASAMSLLAGEIQSLQVAMRNMRRGKGI